MSEPLIGKWERRLFFIAAIGLLYLIAHNLTSKPEQLTNFVKTDTVKVEKIIHLQPIQNKYPEKVIIQEKRDTVYRHTIEKQTIITGASFDSKKNEIALQKIDSLGREWEERYKIQEGSKVIVDNNHFQEKGKTRTGKILKKAKKVILRGLEVVGAVAIIYLAVK